MLNSTLDRAAALIARGCAMDALTLTTPLAASASANVNVLGAHAAALKAVGDHEAALETDRRAVAGFPTSAVAWHNLAATLGDMGRLAEACDAVAQAQARGLDASETWVVLGRALGGLGDLAGGEEALREALLRAPRNSALASELAEFIWTGRGALDDALGILRRATADGAAAAPLVLREAGLLAAAGRPETALSQLLAVAAAVPDEAAYVLPLSDGLLKAGRLGEALDLARRAAARQPSAPAVLCQLANVQSACGRPSEAMTAARAGLAVDPASQPLLNALATAARLAGDPLYGDLCDHDAMVGVFEIERPAAWRTLGGYLADLALALDRSIRTIRHPSDQSLQGGGQTSFRLSGSPEPAIQAFFHAADAPIRTHMAALGAGSDPLRRRNADDYRLSGAWSVRLARGDYHRDHIHSEGWLSSAFYVETPDAALAGPRREGWLRFGQPAFQTDPELKADHHVRPQPGRLVLFPSYMWHGTEPFHTDERRLTIAFDLVPTALRGPR